MKRIANIFGANWGKNVRSLFALCAITAIVVPAQTFKTNLVAPAPINGQKAHFVEYGKLPLSFESNQGQADALRLQCGKHSKQNSRGHRCSEAEGQHAPVRRESDGPVLPLKHD